MDRNKLTREERKEIMDAVGMKTTYKFDFHWPFIHRTVWGFGGYCGRPDCDEWEWEWTNILTSHPEVRFLVCKKCRAKDEERKS